MTPPIRRDTHMATASSVSRITLLADVSRAGEMAECAASRLISIQSRHAGKGSKRIYWCYIVTSVKNHIKSMGWCGGIRMLNARARSSQ